MSAKEQTPEEKMLKAYYIIYPDKSFDGLSAGVYFKDGKSTVAVSDESLLSKFKGFGYDLELVK